tara:strand:+ start:158 stop:370 length:213 start_codon:yes stop_codon:yes gene_type:complete
VLPVEVEEVPIPVVVGVPVDTWKRVINPCRGHKQLLLVVVAMVYAETITIVVTTVVMVVIVPYQEPHKRL